MHLNDFPYDAGQQRQEAVVRAGKMSIQGVQPKLSVRLDAKAGVFVIVDQGGRFVLKPQHATYPNLPENEGLTMHLAKLCGIEAPVSGIVRSADGTWSYFRTPLRPNGTQPQSRRGGLRPTRGFQSRDQVRLQHGTAGKNVGYVLHVFP